MNRLFLLFVCTLCLNSTIATANSELYVPELRYTCTQNVIDIHLSEHATSAGVNEKLLGSAVPWEQTFSLKDGYPQQGNPMTLECALWSGIYVVRIGAV
jgi:hypothetical protein